MNRPLIGFLVRMRGIVAGQLPAARSIISSAHNAAGSLADDAPGALAMINDWITELEAAPARACRRCGCSDAHPCDGGGCVWASADLCSRCVRDEAAELAGIVREMEAAETEAAERQIEIDAERLGVPL
jgi:hypothetical protein